MQMWLNLKKDLPSYRVGTNKEPVRSYAGDYRHAKSGADAVCRYFDLPLLSGQCLQCSQGHWWRRCWNDWAGITIDRCGYGLRQLPMSHSTFAGWFPCGVRALCTLSWMRSCKDLVPLQGSLIFRCSLRLWLSLDSKQISFFMSVRFDFLRSCGSVPEFPRYERRDGDIRI